MPTLWYHAGPHAGKIVRVDAARAKEDIDAGLAQDMAKTSGAKLKRPTYETRDMRATPPTAPADEPAKKKGKARKPEDAVPTSPAAEVEVVPAPPAPAPTPAPTPEPAPADDDQVKPPPSDPPAESGTGDMSER
jgi:hypothetical protein